MTHVFMLTACLDSLSPSSSFLLVIIMDEGDVHYVGPWNEGAQKLLSKYLPVSHLLAAAGGAEQPRDDKPKKKKETAVVAANKDVGKDKAKKSHSSSLTLRSAMWEYCWEARWWIFCCSLFFFLAAQTSRQVNLTNLYLCVQELSFPSQPAICIHPLFNTISIHTLIIDGRLLYPLVDQGLL
jgi:hypothetical protein